VQCDSTAAVCFPQTGIPQVKRSGRFLGFSLAAAVVLVAGSALVPPARAQAKGPFSDIWIVGGDLPHPVKIANE